MLIPILFITKAGLSVTSTIYTANLTRLLFAQPTFSGSVDLTWLKKQQKLLTIFVSLSGCLSLLFHAGTETVNYCVLMYHFRCVVGILEDQL